jgi:FAD dependent oxidoreductase TIGR03364
MSASWDLVVVGGGIVGLAHAALAARGGRRVLLLERDPRALGASIRNFGMVWPIGQRPGPDRERALRSRAAWRETLAAAGLPFREDGSVHLAAHPLEESVLREYAASPAGRETRWLDRGELEPAWTGLLADRVRGGLWSPTEMLVEPLATVRGLADWLAGLSNVTVRHGVTVTDVAPGRVRANRGEFSAERVLVATGSTHDTFHPDAWAAERVTRCRLLMLRVACPVHWRLPAAVASGMSTIHYPGFAGCASREALRAHYRETFPALERDGVHLLVAQHRPGELIVGDSHEYGEAFEPFLPERVADIILDALDGLLALPERRVLERWDGVYLKHLGEAPYRAFEPEPGVRVVNAFGGAGMTLSFGAALESLEAWGWA